MGESCAMEVLSRTRVVMKESHDGDILIGDSQYKDFGSPTRQGLGNVQSLKKAVGDEIAKAHYYDTCRAVKCSCCGANLTGLNPTCGFCGSREQIDLLTVNRRNLGLAEGMECPRCEASLEVWKLAPTSVDVDLAVERCPGCHGIFFNPGELEAFLQHQVVATTWLDLEKLETMRPTETDVLGKLGVRERHYLPCPTCKEIMNSQNFGRRSGVLVDLCRAHGIWLDGGELRKVCEWWRAGGEHVDTANETKRALAMQRTREPRIPRSVSLPFESDDAERRWTRSGSGTVELVSILAAIIGYFLS